MTLAATTGDDLTTVAHGVNLDPALVHGIVLGHTRHLELDQIPAICAALCASPETLWGPGALRVADSYPPDQWPQPVELPVTKDGPPSRPHGITY